MDGLVGLLIVWAIIGLIGNTMKKAKKAAGDANKKPASEPAAKPVPAKPKPSVWEQIEMMGMLGDEEETEKKPEKVEKSPDKNTEAWGSLADYKPMLAPMEGAAKPGSLANYSPEGAGMSSFFANNAQTKPETDGASRKNQNRIIARVSPRDMKTAVVMSEILSRPVSMRRQTAGFQRRRCGV